jgi:predicted Rossmann-fold nucleotide-binding protein
MIHKIISGGQTGADRAALDFAIEHNIPYGGWVPKGRKTEDGALPDKYNLQEMSSTEYSARTEQNILDSDGTLIVFHGHLTGGSALTEFLTEKHHKPCLSINLNRKSLFESAEEMQQWLKDHDIKILNVAGPRASYDARIYQGTLDLLKSAFAIVSRPL